MDKLEAGCFIDKVTKSVIPKNGTDANQDKIQFKVKVSFEFKVILLKSGTFRFSNKNTVFTD